MNSTLVRRLATVGLWTILDFFLTVFANLTLVYVGATAAIFLNAMLAFAVNAAFLYLLHFEKEFPQWITDRVEDTPFSRAAATVIGAGRIPAVLAAYIISGPAMVGTPLLWLFGIRGTHAYLLAAAGIVINSIIWVGGVYNLFWMLVRTITS